VVGIILALKYKDAREQGSRLAVGLFKSRKPRDFRAKIERQFNGIVKVIELIFIPP
jgi:hypothetical protein